MNNFIIFALICYILTIYNTLRYYEKDIVSVFVFASCAFSLPVYAQEVGSFEVGNKVFLLDGKPFVIKAAEIHYPRIPREYWEHRIKMCKALGTNTLCIYIFWNIHEQQDLA